MASNSNLREEIDECHSQTGTASFCEEDFDSDDFQSEDTEHIYFDDEDDDDASIEDGTIGVIEDESGKCTYIGIIEDELHVEMQCFCTPNCSKNVNLDF